VKNTWQGTLNEAQPLGYERLDLKQAQRDKRIRTAIQIALLGVVGVWMLIAGSVLFSPPLHRGSVRNSQGNLLVIYTACMNYGQDHDHAFPHSLEELLAQSCLTADRLVCPNSDDTPAPGDSAEEQASNLSKGHHLSYVYVGNGMAWPVRNAATTVIAYERLDIHKRGGIYFLFADGRVQLLDIKKARALIAAIPTTQPTAAP